VKKNDVVTIGPTLVVILERRIAMIRGVGEVWVTDARKMVTSTTDICGHTNWTLVEDFWQFHGHYSSLGFWSWEPGPGVFGGKATNIFKESVLKKGGKTIQITMDEWPGA
jgi:hypothetical protein